MAKKVKGKKPPRDTRAPMGQRASKGQSRKRRPRAEPVRLEPLEEATTTPQALPPPQVMPSPQASPPAQARPVDRPDSADLFRIVAIVGVGLWRIRQKLVRPGTEEPIEGAQKAFRHVQALWDGLAEAGVRIQDHTGEVLPGGGAYSLSILGFQPTAGVTREVVLETIKPTVYFHGRMVQMGEVIVATSERSGSETPH